MKSVLPKGLLKEDDLWIEQGSSFLSDFMNLLMLILSLKLFLTIKLFEEMLVCGRTVMQEIFF